MFNIQINDGVVYMCLVDLSIQLHLCTFLHANLLSVMINFSFRMRMSFSFLAEVINRFTTTYSRLVRGPRSRLLFQHYPHRHAQAVRQAITGQMKDFDRTLQQLMVRNRVNVGVLAGRFKLTLAPLPWYVRTCAAIPPNDRSTSPTLARTRFNEPSRRLRA